MARSIRVEYEGAYYHVMARGNRRGPIFLDDDDHRFFLKAISEVCEMTGWRVHAWVLMGNHYHLFIQTPEANLVEGMKWLQNTYTRRFNLRHKQWGRLFGDRYKAILVEGGSPYYYETMLDYIHLNPVRAGLVNPAERQSVLDYPWSSLAGGYALAPQRRPRWLAAGDGLQVFGYPDTATGRQKMAERLDRRAVEESAERCGIPVLPEEIDARCSHLRRGWYWGTQKFSEKLLRLAKGAIAKPRSRALHGAPEYKAHGYAEAEALLRAALLASRLDPAKLAQLSSSDPRKLGLAALLRKLTIVSNAWLAEQLHLKSAANVSQRLRTADVAKLARALPAQFRSFLKVQA